MESRTNTFIVRVSASDGNRLVPKKVPPYFHPSENGHSIDLYCKLIRDAMEPSVKADHIEQDPHQTYYEFTFRTDNNGILVDQSESEALCLQFVEKHFNEAP